MHPHQFAQSDPDRAAVIMAGSGLTMTYAELESLSNQFAHLFRSKGLREGDVVAILLGNRVEFLAICWAAQRAGLYWTCIPNRLRADEIAYIVNDSGAALLISEESYVGELSDVSASAGDCEVVLLDSGFEGASPLLSAVAGLADTPIADESHGTDMLYSSGTTGRPKGIKPMLPGGDIAAPYPLALLMTAIFGVPDAAVYLCPAPLYHAAPLRWSMAIHRTGGTVIVMEKFEAEAVLQLIERFQVNTAQFVPTHFSRLLKLPADIREKYDHSSLKSVIHAAAPCPVDVKRAMIEWWGPIIHEYYSGTEGIGMTAISSKEWVDRPGSVGRAILGTLRVCDETGEPVSTETVGHIYFEGGPSLAYHNDPAKTASSHNRYGWASLGDIGKVDEEGYLFLTDRKNFMIISGGVNIYPQETEDLLISHPAVADAAVIGAPDPDLGERVVAVVQLENTGASPDEVRDLLMSYLRQRLSPVKLPKQLDFVSELPRQPTGKLNKLAIRSRYWE